jgi:large subunit ribosomal protein L21
MYAVIQSGGKQYRVEPGQTVTLEKIEGDKGAAVDFNDVLLLSSDGSVTIGRPTVPGAVVKAQIVEHTLGDKLVVFKFRRRKNYVRKNGHRQQYTRVKIEQVVSP